MIIPKIVEVMQRLDRAQSSMHKKLDAIQLDLHVMLRAMGSTRRPSKKEKSVNCSPEDLRVSMHDKSQVAMESAQVEAQVSAMLHDAIRQKSVMTKEHMREVKHVLESYKELNAITEKSKEQSSRLEKALQVLNSKIKQFDKVSTEARSIVANHVKPKNKIFRPGVT